MVVYLDTGKLLLFSQCPRVSPPVAVLDLCSGRLLVQAAGKLSFPYSSSRKRLMNCSNQTRKSQCFWLQGYPWSIRYGSLLIACQAAFLQIILHGQPGMQLGSGIYEKVMCMHAILDGIRLDPFACCCSTATLAQTLPCMFFGFDLEHRCGCMALTSRSDMQQADVLRKHLDLRIGTYFGEMNVDCWNKVQWLKEWNSKDVMIMTPQILLDILRHGFVKVRLTPATGHAVIPGQSNGQGSAWDVPEAIGVSCPDTTQ